MTTKNEVTHTPGPWFNNRSDRTIRSVHNMRAWQREGENQKQFVICKFPMRDANYPISHEEWEANARLIAAAPELLKACKAAVVSMSDDAYYQYMKHVIQTLEIAIAKVEGKQ